LKRNVDEHGALGKDFVAILPQRAPPRLAAREGATLSIYWGQVSAHQISLATARHAIAINYASYWPDPGWTPERGCGCSVVRPASWAR